MTAPSFVKKDERGIAHEGTDRRETVSPFRPFPARRKALSPEGVIPALMADRGSSEDLGSPRFASLHLPSLRVLLPLVLVGVLVLVSTAIFGVDGLNSAINGVTDASILIPGAVGLSLLYGIRKFANFAHGELMTLGGYTAFVVNVQFGLALYWGFVAAPIVLACTGILLEVFVFSRLEGRGSVPPLVASIGLSLFLQSLVAVLFGTNIQSYRYEDFQSWVFLGGATLPPIKGAVTIVLSVVFMLSVHSVLTRTTLGKSMRATADNMELARTTGIKTRSVILWTWVLSAALAGVGGVLIGVARDVRPTMGFDLLLLVFAAVILGGIGSAYGAMLGGLVIGLATNMSVPYLQWLDKNAGLANGGLYGPAIAFLIMVLVLLVRPEGMLGPRRERGGAGAVRWLLSRLTQRSRTADAAEPEGK